MGLGPFRKNAHGETLLQHIVRVKTENRPQASHENLWAVDDPNWRGVSLDAGYTGMI